MLAGHAKIPTQHHLTPRRIQTVNSFLKETLQYLEAGEWLWQKAWACLSGNIARSAIWPLNILTGLQRRKGMWAREKKGWSGCSPFIYRYSTSSVTTSTNTDPRSAHSDGSRDGSLYWMQLTLISWQGNPADTQQALSVLINVKLSSDQQDPQRALCPSV